MKTKKNGTRDLIDRQAAIMHFVKASEHYECGMFNLAEVTHELWKIASVQPERKKGKWITETINSYTKRTYCSICNEPAPFIYINDDEYNYSYGATELTNFCPNCGADMRGKQDDTD